MTQGGVGRGHEVVQSHVLAAPVHANKRAAQGVALTSGQLGVSAKKILKSRSCAVQFDTNLPVSSFRIERNPQRS